MCKLIELIKSLFIQHSVESITQSLAKTVAKLEAHTVKVSTKIDEHYQTIDDKKAEHRAEMAAMALKGVELRQEVQKAASIATNIGKLLQ